VRLASFGLSLLLVELGCHAAFTHGPSPGSFAALSAGVLLAVVFCSWRVAAGLLAAASAFLFGVGTLVAAGRLPVPGGYAFDEPDIFLRSSVNVLCFAVVLAMTVRSLLQRYEQGLAERAESIARLRRGQQQRAEEEARRDRAIEALARAQQHALVGQLSSALAHDFNNMLVVMLSWAELLGDASGTGLEQIEAAEIIAQSAQRASDVTRQLVALGESGSGQPEVLQLPPLVGSLLRSLRRLLPKEIKLQQEGVLPSAAKVEPARLEQTLLNFALNARDAMPAGGVLGFGCGPATDVERGPLPAPCVAIRVRDTGCGMDAATQARLFQPFFSTKGEGRGLGLGLASAQAVAAAHGGRIHVESAPGRGSCFTLVLPSAGASKPTLETGSFRFPSRLRLLLVEDEEPVRQVMARSLRASGLEVLEAADGASALQALRGAGALDVLCVDGILPDMLSQQVIDDFSARNAGAPVLVCSGHAAAPGLRARVEGGRHAFLAKPFAGTALVRAVAGLVAAPSLQPPHQRGGSAP
jgi:signal transduction histidine kinase/CheY-like chemotaxis protein